MHSTTPIKLLIKEQRLNLAHASNEKEWSNMHIDNLLHIFSFLDFTNLLSAQKVCKNWRLVGEEEIIWKNLCAKIVRVSLQTLPPLTKNSTYKNYVFQEHRLKFFGLTLERKYQTNSLAHGRYFIEGDQLYLKQWKSLSSQAINEPHNLQNIQNVEQLVLRHNEMGFFTSQVSPRHNFNRLITIIDLNKGLKLGTIDLDDALTVDEKNHVLQAVVSATILEDNQLLTVSSIGILAY